MFTFDSDDVINGVGFRQTEYEFREYRKQVEKTEKEKDRRFKELQDKVSSRYLTT